MAPPAPGTSSGAAARWSRKNPATAEAPQMPTAAIAAGAVDRVLTLDEIGGYINVASVQG